MMKGDETPMAKPEALRYYGMTLKPDEIRMDVGYIWHDLKETIEQNLLEGFVLKRIFDRVPGESYQLFTNEPRKESAIIRFQIDESGILCGRIAFMGNLDAAACFYWMENRSPISES